MALKHFIYFINQHIFRYAKTFFFNISNISAIFIIGAKRTPFCKYGGPLRELPASHVFAAAAKEAISSANVDPSLIDNTIVGNVNFVRIELLENNKPVFVCKCKC